MEKTTSKALKLATKVMMATMPMTGMIIGTRMRVNCCQGVAPSMEAASMRSSSMLWKAATNIIVGMPTHCQTDTRETADRAVPGSPSQPWGEWTRKPRPIFSSGALDHWGFIIILNR